MLGIFIPHQAHPTRYTADVIVYGGTPAGITAALAAQQNGAKVILIEPSPILGGNFAAGLGAPTIHEPKIISGLSKKFFDEIATEYTKPNQRTFEPKIARMVFQRMVASTSVRLFTDQTLTKVTKTLGRITEITTDTEDTFVAKIYIDATYEGDLMAKARVLYTIGREGRQQYGESLAGIAIRVDHAQFDVDIPARDQAKNMLQGVILPPETGARDANLPAANINLIFTKSPANRIDITAPDQYNAKDYELLARYLEKRPTTIITDLFDFKPLPNDKFQVSPTGPLWMHLVGLSRDYPDANISQRERVHNQHLSRIKGLFFFLKDDPRTPQLLKNQLEGWGLASDEFERTNNFPQHPQLHSGRRLLGTQVMTQSDLTVVLNKRDVIAIGTAPMTCPPVTRVLDEDLVRNEGTFNEPVVPYQIGYRSLLPKASQCQNLIIPVCLAASHVAYSSMNDEITRMNLGQAAGTAAAIAVRDNRTVHLINVKDLQKTLADQGQLLELTAPKIVKADDIEGIVVDDLDAQLDGEWFASATNKPFIGKGYLHDNNENKGQCAARFIPQIPATGKYRVELAYKPHETAANRVPIAILTADGVRQVFADLTQPLPDNELFTPLGTFNLNEGTETVLTLTNINTTGRVSIDAVRFIRILE